MPSPGDRVCFASGNGLHQGRMNVEQNKSVLRKEEWGMGFGIRLQALLQHYFPIREHLPSEVGSWAQDHRIHVWANLDSNPDLSDASVLND